MTTPTIETIDPATDKQVRYLASLVDKHELPGDFVVPDPLTRTDASELIARALTCPKKTVPTVELGYYLYEGDVFTVVENQAKTGTYAKRLRIEGGDKPRAKWKYEPGMMNALAGAPRLTVAEAASLGHLHGVCVVCGKRLTDPESVTRGIGPVCITRI
jgi:hypothetical protein